MSRSARKEKEAEVEVEEAEEATSGPLPVAKLEVSFNFITLHL
jgi:hypothetical protein